MEVVRGEDLSHRKPEIKDYQYSSSAKVFQTEQLFLYSEVVEPGRKSSAPHYHELIDEIVVITMGELFTIEGDEEVLLKNGDSICFFANSQKQHFLENRSDKIAEFLLFRKSTNDKDVIY